jgi:signal transduction histidine kinase
VRGLHAQLMAATSLLLATVVGTAFLVLYLIGLAGAGAAAARALRAGVALAAQAAAGRGGASLRDPALGLWQAGTGGSLEVVDRAGHLFWREGPPLPGAWVHRALAAPGRPLRAGPAHLVAAVRLPRGTSPARLFVVGGTAVRPPAFPSAQDLAVAAAGLAGLALAQLLWALVARRLAARLRHLAAVVERYAQGEFSLRPDVRSPVELARLAEAVARMAEALGAERRAREAFLAEVAHDLRTPLTAIRALLASAADAPAVTRAGPLRERLAGARREAERLTRLVNDLLDLARYESGHLQVPLGRVDLREVAVLGAVSGEAAAAAAGLRFEVALPPAPVWVRANLDRGAQVLVNLVDNAVRHAGRGGLVRVAVAPDGGSGVVRVEDTGPGFEPGAAAWVWSAFTRGKTARESDGGTGLGLAVGRALARAMGGDLCILEPEGERRGRVELRLEAWPGDAARGAPPARLPASPRDLP